MFEFLQRDGFPEPPATTANVSDGMTVPQWDARCVAATLV